MSNLESSTSNSKKFLVILLIFCVAILRFLCDVSVDDRKDLQYSALQLKDGPALILSILLIKFALFLESNFKYNRQFMT